MKICVTGVYTEQLKKWCEEMGFEVVSHCSYESNVVLHNICGCCDPKVNFQGTPETLGQRCVYLFVTDRSEEIKRYPFAVCVTGKKALMDLIIRSLVSAK